jgi:predicted HAD superfamily phosphohydrolase
VKDIFFTDWEGPWITTDFAYEAALAFLNNYEFFRRLSQYDDYLAYVVKKEDYEAGDTLRLLAPFLVAAEVTTEELYQLSEKIATFVPDAFEAMQWLLKRYTPVVISTSYSAYLERTAGMLGISEHLHGTTFDPEKYSMDRGERKWLLDQVDIIASLPQIEIENSMISDDAREAVEYLDRLFWEEMPKRCSGAVLNDVRAIGGKRKLEIVKKYAFKHRISADKLIVIGDSISDYAMLQWVKDMGGIAASFNGNEYALEHSNLFIISETAWAEATVVDLFFKQGRDAVVELARLQGKLDEPDELTEKVAGRAEFYWYEDIYEDIHWQDICIKSEEMRRKVRGEAGTLG